ncbi:MAG: hypothetical protein K6A70_08005 [Erysipelotrichaceae bacterium]|nr:hypothetical protein [Erysipelotrichaceae bacterium]
MKVTLGLAFLSMTALLLLVYAAVAMIQDRRFFTTAPKDIQEAAIEHEERFKGQRLLGWILALIALGIFVFILYYAGYDAIRNGYSFYQIFARYLTILYLLKAFDIIFLDYYLLTKAHFFQHYYPETEGCKGCHSFGFNWKGQLTRIIIFPFVSLHAAYICTQIR